MEDVRVTTWSHSTYKDIWPMYYGQFKKYAPDLKHAIFIEKSSDELPEYCAQIINNEKDPYSQRFLESLKQVEEQNIIYMQEDFVLYSGVQIDWLRNIKDFLNNSDYSFVRLIKSGVEGGALLDEELGIWEVPRGCQYLFSANATIWKKSDFVKLYKFFKPGSLLDSELYGSDASRALGIKGCYIYKGEPKRGDLHYDSTLFPYMSSALTGYPLGGPSRWLMKHYEQELQPLFETYNIDPAIRGTI